MSDEIKTQRELILDDIRKMDEICADYDRSWSDALIDWIFVLNNSETLHNLSKSNYYRDVLLRDFFLCGDFDATLGIIVDAFRAGDVHHLRAENDALRRANAGMVSRAEHARVVSDLTREVERLRARVAVLERACRLIEGDPDPHAVVECTACYRHSRLAFHALEAKP